MDMALKTEDPEHIVGMVSLRTQHLEATSIDMPYFFGIGIDINYNINFDQDGFEDNRILASVEVKLHRMGSPTKGIKFASNREDFHSSFSTNGPLTRQIADAIKDTEIAEKQTVADAIIESLRKFIMAYCEQKFIIIFDK